MTSESQESVVWVNASREPSFEQFWPLLAGVAALVVGSFGVAYRVYFCRAPAFVALAIGALALMLYLQAKSRRRERSIKTIRSVYSLDHATRVQAALALGARASDTSSHYERLHYERCRTWLLLTLWVLWLFYGAVFHSGEHAPSEDALLVDLTGVGTDVPHLARIARLYLLALVAVASLWYSFASSDAGSDPSAMVESGRGLDSDIDVRGGWPMVFTVSFFVLLFLPTPDSTPQALHVTQLISRTVVFASLFAASEVFDSTLRYTRWLAAYNNATAELIEGTQMALGRVHRRPLLAPSPERTRSEARLDQLAPPPSAAVASDVARSFSLLDAVARWGIVLRSAWVLVASAEAHHLALLELLVVLGLIVRMRLRARAAVIGKPELLQLQLPVAVPASAAGAMTPPESPTTASAPPPPQQQQPPAQSKSDKKEKKTRGRDRKPRATVIDRRPHSGSDADTDDKCKEEYLASTIAVLRDDSPSPPPPQHRTRDRHTTRSAKEAAPPVALITPTAAAASASTITRSGSAGVGSISGSGRAKTLAELMASPSTIAST